MALITKASLRRVHITKAASELEEGAKSTPMNQDFDVFLSHSYADAKSSQALAAEDLLGLKCKLEEDFGLSVYVDWVVDRTLDRSTVDVRTASVLKARMDHCRCLLYATSEQAEKSKWMPWELGYFDGKKGRVAILPVVSSTTSSFKGQDYLSLYPYVDEAKPKNVCEAILWVNEAPNKYVALAAWLKGNNPVEQT